MTNGHNADRGFLTTDLGNAKRLVSKFGPFIRFCTERKCWLFWHQGRWNWDTDGGIVRTAKRVATDLLPKACELTNLTDQAAMTSWAITSQSASRIKAMIELAKTEKDIPLSESHLDQDPMRLGLKEETLDLSTGKLLLPDSGHLITKASQIRFDQTAKCPTWERFLITVFDGDQNLIAFVQRVVGYSLTGLTNEQVMFILHGSGANGKSVFLRVIGALMGDYALSTPPETLMQRRETGGASPDLARLKGARVVFASEPNEACILAESVVKQITGQDVVVCRHLYGGFFEYVPHFKVFLATNHKPIIRGDDHGIWRRIILIPFSVTIPPEQQDKSLTESLIAEQSGILNWALEGLQEYRKSGLSIPSSVRDATQEYRSEMDLFGDWLIDCCDQTPSSEAPAKSLYKSYRNWCENNGLKPMSQKALSQKLKRRGFEGKHTRFGTSYIGLQLRHSSSSEENILDAITVSKIG